MRHKINVTITVDIPEKPGYSIMFRRPKHGESWGMVYCHSYGPTASQALQRVIIASSPWDDEKNQLSRHDVECFVYIPNPKRITFTPVIGQDGLHVVRCPRTGEWYQNADGALFMAPCDFVLNTYPIYTRTES